MTRTIALIASLALAGTAFSITIETVPVGNPGNPADTRYIDSAHPNGVGMVAYSFLMGKTEITNAQYATFLNSVAASDPYGLFSGSMSGDILGGITRSGFSGSYVYAVKTPALSGSYTYENKPVVFVTHGDAMRFTNWLHNGQPIGAPTASTTEEGAYALNGATTQASLALVTRKPGARWWLPGENEWYKAAYHKNDGVTANYWDYPTGTNSRPNNNLPSSDTGNSSNIYDQGFATGLMNYPMTDAGAYPISHSSYNTSDQDGNAFELNETVVFVGTYRGRRGGAFNNDYTFAHASEWGFSTENGAPSVGFRVAGEIPEPSTLLLAIAAVAALPTHRRKSVPHNRA